MYVYCVTSQTVNIYTSSILKLKFKLEDIAVNFMTKEKRIPRYITFSLMSIKLNIGLLRLHWLLQSSNNKISNRVFKI